MRKKCEKHLPRVETPEGKCKECVHVGARRRYANSDKEKKSAYGALYYQTNRDVCLARNKSSHIKRKYQLDDTGFALLAESQNHKCGICGDSKKLVVDHCHITQKIRGLLCVQCNAGLGMYKDNVVLLRAALAWVENDTN